MIELSHAALIWFSCCATTLVLLLALPVARRLTSGPAPTTGFTRRDWALVASLGLAGVLLRAWFARHLAFEIDEYISQGYDSLWREFDGEELMMNPPLYRVVSFPVTALLGNGPGPGRITPVLLGFPLIATTASIGALLGGRRAGLVAAVVAAIHPGLVLATVYDRGYALLAVATALSLLMVVVALRSGRALDRYLLATCLAATLLSHYMGATVAAGVALWLLLAEGRRAGRWLGPLLLLVVLVLPFAPVVLAGAQTKALEELTSARIDYAAHLALSIPGTMAGLLPLRLETPVFPTESTGVLTAGVLLFVLSAAAGLRSLRGTDRIGLFAFVVLATGLPVALAIRLTTVREFSAIAAAVPFSILVAVGATGLRRASIVGTIAALAVLLHGLPWWAPAQGDPERAADFIRGDRLHWPLFVWGKPEPGFVRVALALGIPRKITDMVSAGRDPRVRPLSSCSSAGVREAASVAGRPIVRLLVLHASCVPAELLGPGVRCEAVPAPEDMSAFDCSVEPAAAAPEPVPANRVPIPGHAIVPGHESLFMSAVLPLQLDGTDPHGTRLTSIRIYDDHVGYDLQPEEGLAVTVSASPRVQGGAVVGTDFSVTPSEARLPPVALASVREIEGSLTSRLTPAAWMSASQLAAHEPPPAAPAHFTSWIVWWALAIGALLVQLISGALRRRPA